MEAADETRQHELTPLYVLRTNVESRSVRAALREATERHDTAPPSLHRHEKAELGE